MPEIIGVQNKHNTVDAIAGLISGLGWTVVLLALLGLLLGLGDNEIPTLMAVLYGIGGVVFGLALVAQGQMLSVIGSIELNTQRTFRILAQQAGADVFAEESSFQRADGSTVSARTSARRSKGMASDDFSDWLKHVRANVQELESESDAALYSEYYSRGQNPWEE